MNPSELTVIIPFRNEKYEVEETLKSILEHSDGNVEILLINDASDDDFDYKTVAEKYHAGYACGKEYWLYLNGLEGLMQYGNDEAYISIKVWL